ncbi:CSC1-like protein At1g69450 isoform X1 [Vitis riparia]|uniref:CSC1-like protein At1g69450 isoform X1 n=1 Tax=Vitis riparia TaxID=96939 RepID=UPI00155A27D0|nr:CSC1-like protein At1g69450 isoform X1 [Vitis riparia]XP_034681280.1 CSC1-like protein At1g69450 isoform X1 [Vitis riparia]
MLVSSLLTSLGINFGLCILFFMLYSILKKQPGNFEVYAPRLLAEGKSKRISHFNLERLLPSPGWVRRAWQPSEEELLSSSGLDTVVFMRIFIFSFRVFLVAGILGIFVLLPVNCVGDQLKSIDFSDFSNNSLDLFTISNVKNGSKWLWLHFCSVYIVTVWVCYLLYYEYKYISLKRIAYFYSSKPQPHQFTILVHSIPVSAGSSVGDTVENFFTEYYPSTYLSNVVVRRTNRLRGLITDAKKLYKKLVRLQSEPNQPKLKRGFCFGLVGQKVDLVDQYEKKLEDLEENVRLEQSEVSLAEEDVRAAFVSFKSRYDAAIAFHLQQSIDPTQWVAQQAPEPHDVYWPFFSSSFMRRWISKLLVIVAFILLTILFLIPVVIVQGLTNLNQLETWLPFLKSILTITIVSEVITGYLPSLILQLFLKAVPPIMEFFSSIQGYMALSDIEKSACNKVLWFTIWNVFFANVLSGSALYLINIILDPKNIPAKLAVAVPAQASFFIAYVVTSGWTGVSSELFRVIPFICSLIRKPFVTSEDDDIEVPSIPYHKEIPKILFFGLLGITYFFLAPLILPFLLVYLCLGYIIFRNQFLNVYAPKYETAGKFWPIVHNSMIFSLVLMHAIAIGIFTVKKLSLASTLIFPLPVLTLLFNEYCRKRFLPIFIAYSAEFYCLTTVWFKEKGQGNRREKKLGETVSDGVYCFFLLFGNMDIRKGNRVSLIKRDRQDQNEPSMDEFFHELVTAYQDPALAPIQYSSNRDSLTSPLISSDV